MAADEIIKELWRIKDEYAREHGYDLHRIFADFREREKQHPERLVDRRRER